MVAGVRVEARDLAWSNAGVAVLRGVSLDLAPGTVTACLGPNGSGKTTLLNLLSGWAAPRTGEIIIDGRLYASISPEEAFRLGIMRRFDPPKLIRELSVFENICLTAMKPPRDGIFSALFGRGRSAAGAKEVRRRAQPILESLGLDGKLARLVESLSVGEQKLLDFALALLSGAPCLLLDEPIKDRIDDRRKSVIVRAIRTFADAGGSVLFVEHDVPFVREVCDRILVLGSDGRATRYGAASDAAVWEAVKDTYRTREVGVTKGDVREPPASRAIRASRGAGLTAKNLSATYDSTKVLSDISIDLGPGEIGVLRGENGAGKSTLLYALAGLVQAQGQITLDGSDITRTAAYARARQGLVLVAQEHKVFASMSVGENILIGNERRGAARGTLLAKAFGWFPELRLSASTAAAHLSAGQKQMVAIARALLQAPKCLLLDEPTSGLDPGMRRRVRGLVREVAQAGTAVLMVEHIREGLDEAVDTTFFLKGGKLLSGYGALQTQMEFQEA